MVETQPEVPSAWRVGAVARLAGVTVRTLHHYDQIGLLSPTGRSEAGYRRYSEADLERLQQILFYRELGFGLDEIREVTTQRDGDVVAHLRRQHALLLERIKLLRRMAAAVEKALEARSMGIKLTPEEQFEVFGEHRQSDFDPEVMQRWGDTDAYRESRRRTSAYTKDDWLRIQSQAQAVLDAAVAAMRAGAAPESTEAMDAAEAHRLQISETFYPCSYEIHLGLADAYTSDPRFTAFYEKVAPGLAQYLADAIRANAARST
jgi:DNA-binding transcriptional MerR regulator